MLTACLEFVGLALCVTGSLLVMVACGLPMWKVTAFIDSNIVVAQTIWDGLWMSCVVQSTGQMQCKGGSSQCRPSAECLHKPHCVVNMLFLPFLVLLVRDKVPKSIGPMCAQFVIQGGNFIILIHVQCCELHVFFSSFKSMNRNLF
uniref:Claudin n=1 Tax=Scophthalmus maximus TaxID=52904 RepID=A0A8D3AAJ5_SCOMX